MTQLEYQYPKIDATKLVVEKTTEPRSLPPKEQLGFGKVFTDHMLTLDWDLEKGWTAPRIHPYAKIALDPSAIVFHYAVECFEGMKAYKDADGEIRLFRPELNITRFRLSMERLALPAPSEADLLACIKELVKIESRWIPENARGYSLYIRPTAIATQETLGVSPSSRCKVFVICSPVGPYYKTGFSSVSLFATEKHVRAWPGGTGDAKLGSNYAPGILIQTQVAKQGYAQNLWILNGMVTEVGTMNFFVYWINKDGEKELRTPHLDGTILPGITRRSILELSREWGEFKVTEGPIAMDDIKVAAEEGRLLEVFGSGTAAIVSPVHLIRWRDADVKVPLDPTNPDAQAGPLTSRLADTIMKIQYGEMEHPWSVKL
ncbi:hypothetical protein CXG81DRAFT_9038 [Caulochytrium protostelioides]|uniref:Branched-chain-amino-acid aminotransferase n=1 Tax=Caulochytrium protostelioides TaxID=1555241 RepID=A0A4V1IVF2_9FUNG|nr:hypothetical protein CXG81DRAFT_9038 [Caulochytrium protostelioides]|eukprot:RKP03849.1 hypothetical protein CXG81DRAFT_9038 [Caulochytrium protostelioides]